MDIKQWRPSGWENPYKINLEDWGVKPMQGDLIIQPSQVEVFEAGASAMLESLFKLAKESPTGTFTLDSRPIHIGAKKLKMSEYILYGEVVGN